MDRRSILLSTLVAAAGTASAATASKTDGHTPLRVVYHLSDLDKVSFVLGCVANHIAGVGGPEHVRLAVVVHGPALFAFRREPENIAASVPLAKLTKQNVAFHACGNTLHSLKLSDDALLPGFEIVREGGVVRLAQLQAEGWIYLRP